MIKSLDERISSELEEFKRDGVYKTFNYIESPQAPRVQMEGRGEITVMSSNNYLGLSNEPEVVKGGHKALDDFGAGTASVRFICGTFTVHRELEQALADLVSTESSLTYVSCWNANEGLFATLTGPDDVIISDQLNHASIIDAMRLAKAINKCETTVYAHSDMDELRSRLEAAKDKRTRYIVTDGVFSMEGDIAKLGDIVDLARTYDAVVVVDDSHATGVLGKTGRGTAEHLGVLGDVDIITSTLGKALGGAAGGFVASTKSVVDFLMQRARPQLFSNALPCTVAGSALAAVKHLTTHPEMVAKLHHNASYFREELISRGFKPLPGDTPIIPVILGETSKAIQMSNMLLDEGVFVTGFGFPVVPKGEARVRCQVSAAHSKEDLDRALDAFSTVGRRLELI
ncbi:MAG: glycine C-acetyltransferase [Gemmatimonadota bacterium]|nr:glycine C-acetyltransferase [Gemmatimonadota bacterium]MDH5804576.1 glycine C-acetyltransferase [Gemmatimonadota bacterium]